MATPLKSFELVVSRLRSLYLSCCHALQQTATSLGSDREVLLQAVLSDPDDPDSEILSGSGYAFLRRTSSTFPRQLREMIYVRLLSAFEYYLTETIRGTFLTHRQLFYVGDTVTFRTDEVLSTDSVSRLWSKILNADVRRLTHRGFKEIQRYYKSRIGIDFSEISPSIASLEERHERRHLLVHRIGYTDEKYRHRHNTEERSVTIDEEYLANTFSELQDFARKLDAAIQERKVSAKRIPCLETGVLRIRLRIRVREEKARMLTDRNFRFRVDDNLHRLTDILLSHYRRFDDHTLILQGPERVTRGYLKRVKRAHKNKSIEIISCGPLKKKMRMKPSAKANRELVAKLSAWVPEPPWPVGLHRQAAEAFGVTTGQAWDALSVIKYNKLTADDWILVEDVEDPRE